ncbi:hypothetical protein QTQ03_10660 [Micromonospora sp. WMMA1363]|uniref:hypothetical protein n=1 Tax=Micromonospora sp. WMMA1363 TaxID=3053985 RepID=UPI00259C85A8|nr:hypothetical protein [Micromonospora sp. WMMA1363]MDM4720018.1 hypothetical protein [Micromonospora sp. WMMA1363]
MDDFPTLTASWSVTMRYARAAADDFWCCVEVRCQGLLPEREAAVFLAVLGGWPAAVTIRRDGRRCWP